MSRSGSRSLHLFESTHTFNQKTADALQWMVQSNSVKLPAKHTLYWCTMLKLPEMPGKHHMIGYRPNIAEANRRYVHHMMLYECHDEVCNMYLGILHGKIRPGGTFLKQQGLYSHHSFETTGLSLFILLEHYENIKSIKHHRD